MVEATGRSGVVATDRLQRIGIQRLEVNDSRQLDALMNSLDREERTLHAKFRHLTTKHVAKSRLLPAETARPASEVSSTPHIVVDASSTTAGSMADRASSMAQRADEPKPAVRCRQKGWGWSKRAKG